MGVWEEILELNRSVTSLNERLNDTIHTMNENSDYDIERRDAITDDILELKIEVREIKEAINNIKAELKRIRRNISGLHRRSRFHLEDLFELQEALVAYLSKHPTKYKDIREMVKSTIKLVEARLERRPKVLKIIETENMSEMKKLRVYDLDWAYIQVLNKYSDAEDSNPELADKLQTLMKKMREIIDES